MRKFCLAILFFCLLLLPVFSQSGDWYLNRKISDISFIGLENVNPGDLSGIRRQFVGQNFTMPLYLDLQSRLYALNYFETFESSIIQDPADSEAVILQFLVKERPLINSITFSGNSSIRNREINEVIITKNDDILSNARLRVDAAAIRDLYISKGYPDAAVSFKTELLAEINKVDVVFQVDEGRQTKVKEILFSGNSFASSNTLKKLLTTKPQTLFNSGIFEEGKLNADREAILKYYGERGYIEARVVDIVRSIEQDEKKQNLLTLTFYIEEGVQYTFGGITFQGNELHTGEELGALVRSEEGKVLNKTRLEADLMRIADIYHNDGYIFNEIYPEEVLDDERHVISFVVHIREYGRAHIENIIVRGNTKTKDHVILREIPLEVGDVFSKDKIMQGLNNLNNLQFFSSFIPETPQGSAEGLMDLVITVEEGRTIDLSFGATFTMEAGSFPILGFVRWTDRNFRGRGQELSLQTELSGETQKLNFSFNERWLFGRRWNAGVDFTISHNVIDDVAQDILFPIFTGTTDDDPQMVPDPYDGHWVDSSTGVAWDGTPTQADIDSGRAITDYAYAMKNGETIASAYLMEYETFEFSLGGNTGYTFYTDWGRVGVGTGLSTGLSYTTYDASINRPYNPDIRTEHNAWRFINRWWAKVTYDTRDIIYSPNKGFLLSGTWTYTGGILGGTRNYNKLNALGEFFQKLFEIEVTENWSWKTVFAFHTNLSMVFRQFGFTDDGWGKTFNATQSDLLYIDGMITARGWDSVLNGKVLWDTWMELRNPVVPGIISLNLFVSATGIWSEIELFKQMSLDDFYFSTGFGMQLDIPSFPMGLYFVKRFNFVDGDFTWQPGNLFKGKRANSGLDFVLSFTFNYY